MVSWASSQELVWVRNLTKRQRLFVQLVVFALHVSLVEIEQFYIVLSIKVKMSQLLTTSTIEGNEGVYIKKSAYDLSTRIFSIRSASPIEAQSLIQAQVRSTSKK